MDRETERAKALLKGNTCVSVTGEHILTSQSTGIRPLLEWLAEDENAFRGGAVADRVVGKAAAMLAVYGGAAKLYGGVVSEHAAQYLRSTGLPFSCGKLVPYIVNRSGDGMCPMERRALELGDPEEAFRVFSKLVLK